MKLIAILNLLLLIALAWSWQIQSNSVSQLQTARAKLDRCSEYAMEISRNQNSDLNVGLAESGYDCSREITELLRRQNLASGQAIRVNPPMDVNDQLVIQRIDNPINNQVSLEQIIGLLLQADSSPIRYYTSSISLQAPPTRGTAEESELWEVVDLDLRFVSKSQVTE